MHRQMPKREELTEHRLIGPLARRQELWRFTRRSVPRGVAIGLLVGIFALIPGVQIVGAALMCVPFRGNIPLAAAMTFLTNPGDHAVPRSRPRCSSATGSASRPTSASFRRLYETSASMSTGSRGCCPMRRRRWCSGCW